jgi:sugar/nucleoside kinase (ribokinase family)
MLSYVHAAPETSRRVLELADWYFCNEEEFAHLGGGEPEEFRRRWGLRGLVLKHGAGGVTVYTERGRLERPALLGRVFDTTGAGDALAGGMLARWHRRGGALEALDEAVEYGVMRASAAISDVGTRGLDSSRSEG